MEGEDIDPELAAELVRFEELAARNEYNGGYTREEAERLAQDELAGDEIEIPEFLPRRNKG